MKAEQDLVLSELKTLLESIKIEKMPNETKFIDTFHSNLVDEICKKSPVKAKKHSFYDYLTDLTNTSVSHIFSMETEAGNEVDFDKVSIYEEDPAKTKTIYRSKSFDEYIDENLLEESQIQLETQVSDTESNNEEHGFNLEEFSDTFNLSDIGQQQDLNKYTSASVKSEKSLKRENVDIPKSIISKSKSDSGENYPSVGSSGSFQFNDIIAGDILGDIEEIEIDNNDHYNDHYDDDNNNNNKLRNSSSFAILNPQEDRIVNAIVSKLKTQLQPTLEKLSQESEKYELIKSIYKLPSISNLNDDVKIKYNNKGKRFNLEFDNSIIKEMVDSETANIERKQQNNKKFPIISAEHQIKLNFNKFRKLNTITEAQDEETSYQKIESYFCSSPTYSKSKDTRLVQDLDTNELIILLKNIKEGKLLDIGKVDHLVAMFEQKPNGAINRMDNQNLKTAILLELNKRKVI